MATLNIDDLPDALYRRLAARAEHQRRTVSEEAARLLEEALSRAEPLSILELQGLGKEAWVGTDAAAHVDAERRAWD